MYADVNLFVLPILYDGRVPGVEASARFLRSLAGGQRSIATATLTWDEFAYAVRRTKGPEAAVTAARELLRLPNVLWLQVDLDVLRRAEEVHRSVLIRPRDAIHAACALENGESEVISQDSVFDRVSGLTRIWPPR